METCRGRHGGQRPCPTPHRRGNFQQQQVAPAACTLQAPNHGSLVWEVPAVDFTCRDPQFTDYHGEPASIPRQQPSSQSLATSTSRESGYRQCGEQGPASTNRRASLRLPAGDLAWPWIWTKFIDYGQVEINIGEEAKNLRVLSKSRTLLILGYPSSLTTLGILDKRCIIGEFLFFSFLSLFLFWDKTIEEINFRWFGQLRVCLNKHTFGVL